MDGTFSLWILPKSFRDGRDSLETCSWNLQESASRNRWHDGIAWWWSSTGTFSGLLSQFWSVSMADSVRSSASLSGAWRKEPKRICNIHISCNPTESRVRIGVWILLAVFLLLVYWYHGPFVALRMVFPMDDVSCLAEGAPWCEAILSLEDVFLGRFICSFLWRSSWFYNEYLWIYGNISHLVFATPKVFWSRRPDNIGCLQCKGGRLLTSVAK